MAMSRRESREARYGMPIRHGFDPHLPRMRSRAELLADPLITAPGSDILGHQRLSFLGLDSAHCRTSMGWVGVGQASPPHDAPIEHVLTCLEGTLEFGVGDVTYRLEPLDQLFIPAEVLYRYTNVGAIPVVFYVVMSPTSVGWPTRGDRAPGTGPGPSRDVETAPGDEWFGLSPLSEAETSIGRVRRRDDWLAHPWLPTRGADGWGRQRVVCPGLDALRCRTGLIDVPVGQASPEQRFAVEQIVFSLDGLSEWTVGDSTFALGPFDQLFVPADTAHRFRNLELTATRMLVCTGAP